ncbi:class I SAM-dependent methyltransferase [Alteromonadaceae bacterium M269]|nr:class I SAM-dependent methyltransferase [Alteromonadaceae bacterium M269]
MTLGTEGYERFVQRFVEVSQGLDFHSVCRDFLQFLPSGRARVLDLGAGVGQNSAALSRLGYAVVAVEPMREFLEAAKDTYTDVDVVWFNDSLPQLAQIKHDTGQFSFVLIDGVWHHLNEVEREQTAGRLSEIIESKGKCAISLRNGQAGMGTRVFPIDVDDTITLLEQYGFKSIFCVRNQASILPNKEQVTWARVVLEKL